MHFLANSNFLQALGWAIINSLWQMAFLWIGFQTIIAFSVRRPAVRAKLATALLGAGFAWFAYTLVYHWIVDPASMKRSLLALGSFAAGNQSWNTILQQVLPYASGVYLLLIIVPAIQFLRNYRFVTIIRRSGLSKCDVDLRMFARRLGERMGIKKPVHVYLSELVSSPVTIGFLKPMILMPLAAIANLSQSQLEAVLLHELAHIRRYDYLVNLLVNLVKTVLYFNPFAGMFGKTIEREREKSCDEIVMQFQYDPHGYASALLMLQRNCAQHTAMAVAAAGQRNDLLHRIEKILGIQRKPVPDFRKLAGLLAGLVCVVVLNALFFFSSPVIKNDSFAFSTFSNPFYQLVSDGKAEAAENSHLAKTASPVPVPLAKKGAAARHLPSTESTPEEQEVRLVNSAPETGDGLTLVDERLHAEPVLKKSQEEQVKGVVAATKKVLEQGQWKVVEKNVADALTEIEKETLKQKYLAEVQKVNWQGLESKLRLSYNTIDWPRINSQLNTAITKITIDSLTTVYNVELKDLSEAQKWMNENQVQCIPDTDVKLEEVNTQKAALEQQLLRLKSLRDSKIIHL